MKKLIKAITTEQKNRLQDFINEVNDIRPYSSWGDLIPKSKDVSGLSLTELKAYLITRKEKATYKEIEKRANKINTIAQAGKLVSVKINIEWKRSRMWGNNPTAEAWCSYIDKDGNLNNHYATSGSIGGCGYDKQSAAVADVLKQFNEVLKPLYTMKNKNISIDNRELFGYGSGYGILPYIEGGVGVNCYSKIFETIGYEFKTVASGKTFDSYEITKKK